MVVKTRSGRERILDAAYVLFSRSGVRAIGVDAITAEADVAKMTLYRNFASNTGQDEVNPQQSDDKVTSGATEQNPNVDEPEIGGP